MRKNLLLLVLVGTILQNGISQIQEFEVYPDGVLIPRLDTIAVTTPQEGQLIYFGLQNVASTTCPEGNIHLKSQAEVDLFVLQYPNCNMIEGDLIIGDNDYPFDSSDIVNLSSLSFLDHISGDLLVVGIPDLRSLNGLQNINSTGGQLSVLHNPRLQNLIHLDHAQTVGFGMSITNNDSITRLDGLEGLTSVGGWLAINYNNMLTDVSALGDLVIDGSFWFQENNSLVDLNGLGPISVSEDFGLYDNHDLIDISGLYALDSIDGQIEILRNSKLSNCAILPVCRKLVISSNVEILNNASGCLNNAEVQAACNACTHPDKPALIALYEATNGAQWTNSWDTTDCYVCTWYGVTCDKNSNRVICLDLDGNLDCTYTSQIGGQPGNYLVGSIPKEIKGLQFLEYLSLENNELGGPIEVEIAMLDSLRFINLGRNEISDTLPKEIGDLQVSASRSGSQ